MEYKLLTADFNLFLLPSDTEMTEFIEEVQNLGELFPEIYRRISEDQDVLAKGKKDIRVLDRCHTREKTSDIPGLRPTSVDCDHPSGGISWTGSPPDVSGTCVPVQQAPRILGVS